MNRAAFQFVGALAGAEATRMFLVHGFVPLPRHAVVLSANPILYWLLIGVSVAGLAFLVLQFIRSIFNERKQPNSGSQLQIAVAEFNSGKRKIIFSSTWTVFAIAIAVISWSVYLWLDGNIQQKSLFLGYWFSASIVLLVLMSLTSWSLRVSKTGGTLVFRRLGMVTGNLKLPVSASGLAGGKLAVRKESAEYRIPIKRLTTHDRAILCSLFECEAEILR